VKWHKFLEIKYVIGIFADLVKRYCRCSFGHLASMEFPGVKGNGKFWVEWIKALYLPGAFNIKREALSPPIPLRRNVPLPNRDTNLHVRGASIRPHLKRTPAPARQARPTKPVQSRPRGCCAAPHRPHEFESHFWRGNDACPDSAPSYSKP
jgi:hypothetical protein